MDRFERDSLASLASPPVPGRSAMKLVNAESRATGSGIFVAGAFPTGEQEDRGSSRVIASQEGPPAIEHRSPSP